MTSESKKKLHLSSFLFNCLVENVQTAAIPRVFPVGTVVKKSACQWRRCKDARDRGLITESGRSPGEGHGNPLQYSCGKPHGQRSLAGYSLWGHKESDMTKRAHTDTHTHCCPNACFRNRRTAGSSAPWTAQASWCCKASCLCGAVPLALLIVALLGVFPLQHGKNILPANPWELSGVREPIVIIPYPDNKMETQRMWRTHPLTLDKLVESFPSWKFLPSLQDKSLPFIISSSFSILESSL